MFFWFYLHKGKKEEEVDKMEKEKNMTQN